MNDEERFERMAELQADFLERMKEERDLVEEDFDLIKAAIHETVEYEHSVDWKWWKNTDHNVKYGEAYDSVPDGVDHDDLISDPEAVEDYAREEVVDIWHFVLQEMVVRGMHIEEIGGLVDTYYRSSASPSKAESDFRLESDLVKSLRSSLIQYDDGKRSPDRAPPVPNASIPPILVSLSTLTKKHFDSVEDLYLEFTDKNEENHARQDGESERDGYEVE